MTDAAIIAVGATVGGATGLQASTTRSYYHDAIRPFAHEVRAGTTGPRELSAYAWGVSWRFIAFFAAPFCVLSGAVVSHLLFLPAEVAGIRVAATWLSATIGAALGAAAVAFTIVTHGAVDGLQVGENLFRLVEPVLWLYPAVPVLAAAKMPPKVLGVALVGAAEGVTAAALHAAGADAAVAPAASAIGLASLVLVQIPGSPIQSPPAVRRTDGYSYVRRGLPLLIVIGAGVGVLAASRRLAGDPLAAMLVQGDLLIDAAAVALLTFVAFWPLVAASSVAADSYATQGTPDLTPAAGYLAAGLGPVGGAVAGGVAMLTEVVARTRSMRAVMRRPRLSEVSTAVRESLGDVTLLAFLVGGLSLAAVAGPLAFLAVGLCWLLNEQSGAPVMRLALAPTAALAAVLAAELWAVIT